MSRTLKIFNIVFYGLLHTEIHLMCLGNGGIIGTRNMKSSNSDPGRRKGLRLLWLFRADVQRDQGAR